VTVVLAIGLSFMNNPTWVCKIVDIVPFGCIKAYLENAEIYRVCKDSSDEKRKRKGKWRVNNENSRNSIV